MITLNYEQMFALGSLMRETDSEIVTISELSPHAVYIVMWQDDSDVPGTVATISTSGTIRIEARVAA